MRAQIVAGNYEKAIELTEELTLSDSTKYNLLFDIYVGLQEYDTAADTIINKIAKCYTKLEDVREEDIQKLDSVYEYLSSEKKSEVDSTKNSIEQAKLEKEREEAEKKAREEEKEEKQSSDVTENQEKKDSDSSKEDSIETSTDDNSSTISNDSDVNATSQLTSMDTLEGFFNALTKNDYKEALTYTASDSASYQWLVANLSENIYSSAANEFAYYFMNSDEAFAADLEKNENFKKLVDLSTNRSFSGDYELRGVVTYESDNMMGYVVRVKQLKTEPFLFPYVNMLAFNEYDWNCSDEVRKDPYSYYFNFLNSDYLDSFIEEYNDDFNNQKKQFYDNFEYNVFMMDNDSGWKVYTTRSDFSSYTIMSPGEYEFYLEMMNGPFTVGIWIDSEINDQILVYVDDEVVGRGDFGDSGEWIIYLDKGKHSIHVEKVTGKKTQKSNSFEYEITEGVTLFFKLKEENNKLVLEESDGTFNMWGD